MLMYYKYITNYFKSWFHILRLLWIIKNYVHF